MLKTKGTVFIKYGRVGKPHQRLVQLNEDESMLLWKDPQRITEKARYISCSEIESVVIGADHTKVMQRHKIPVEYDNHCVSIMTPTRTLDLRYDDPKVIQVWVDKIRLIIRLNQEAKEQIEQESFEKSRGQRAECRVVIESVWKNEILLNWGSYWDPANYKLKSDLLSININVKEK